MGPCLLTKSFGVEKWFLIKPLDGISIHSQKTLLKYLYLETFVCLDICDSKFWSELHLIAFFFFWGWRWVIWSKWVGREDFEVKRTRADIITNLLTKTCSPRCEKPSLLLCSYNFKITFYSKNGLNCVQGKSIFYLVASSGLYWSLYTFIQGCKAPA